MKQTCQTGKIKEDRKSTSITSHEILENSQTFQGHILIKNMRFYVCTSKTFNTKICNTCYQNQLNILYVYSA